MYIYCLKCMNPSSDSSTVNRATLDSNNSVNKDWGQLHWILIIEVLQCERMVFYAYSGQVISPAPSEDPLNFVVTFGWHPSSASSYNHTWPESWEIFSWCKNEIVHHLLHVHSVHCKDSFLSHLGSKRICIVCTWHLRKCNIRSEECKAYIICKIDSRNLVIYKEWICYC